MARSTARADTRRWAKQLGIDVRGKPNWRVSFVLCANGRTPPDVLPRRPTSFSLDVSNGFWWVIVQHDGLLIDCSDSFEKGPRFGHTTSWKLKPPPSLDGVFTWLEGIEDKIGERFRRDLPRVRSNVSGGKKATVAWLAAL